ncbi:MAG: nucleotide exchange factor GrpE [Nitrospirae bacterium]|nr:nucleotide exchange factor GrpE [Nitrospirota bacterium]
MKQKKETVTPTGDEKIEEICSEADVSAANAIALLQSELNEVKDRHLRLYAEFENYKKKVQKDREELIRYSNESLVYELLPIIDSMGIALKHAKDESADSRSLIEGVENTERELLRILEKFGLKTIEAANKPFDPAYHHAISQAERDDMESNIVAEEFRRGYLFGENVLRPSLVVVSKKRLVAEPNPE